MSGFYSCQDIHCTFFPRLGQFGIHCNFVGANGRQPRTARSNGHTQNDKFNSSSTNSHRSLRDRALYTCFRAISTVIFSEAGIRERARIRTEKVHKLSQHEPFTSPPPPKPTLVAPEKVDVPHFLAKDAKIGPT